MNTEKLRAWISLSRLPFHSVGLLPFILGNLLAWHVTGSLDLVILVWGTLVVFFALLATYYSGEYFDYGTDALASRLGRNRFSGGSQVLQTGLVPRKHALNAAIMCLAPPLGISLLLQFYYKTGPYTLLLMILGFIGGLLYSTKPVQWAYRGLGEIWIGFCYGWLTVASSYYIQTGRFPALVHWTALPIAFSIFNVILINEFPDYLADKKSGKQNLVVRFGKVRMSKLYILISVAVWVSYILLFRVGIPVRALLFFSPVFVLSVMTAFQMFRGGYREHNKLEGICARTLIINLGVTVSLVLAIWP